VTAGEHRGSEPRRLHRLVGAWLAASVLLTASGAVAAGEPRLSAIVATGPGATVAVLPDGAWRVELAPLLPGDFDPAVSPDGSRVVLASERDGNRELYVADARTRSTRRLTRSAGAVDRRPAWSPDGRSIVWASGPLDAADLFVVRADGSGERRLVGGPGDDTDPAWSPDGAAIVFSSNRAGRRQLWAVAAAGGEPAPLTTLPGRAHSADWAPDGRRLAFVHESAGEASVWVLQLADGSVRRLTRGAGRDSRPSWSPGGDRVAFARVFGGRTALWVVEAEGGGARRLEGTDGLSGPEWARTARPLVPRPDERLPDLDQRAPAGLVVVQEGRRFQLAFASATENRGVGPLVIHGVRRGARTMTARQVVELEGGATRVVRDVGRLRYEPHAPHHHWHLKSFVTYELLRAGDLAVAARDGKSGFCLIDRWGQVSPRMPGTGPPRFVGDCGTNRPSARRVVLGTSVGYVDRYPAGFHGQQLDVTGLPAGRYLLVQRANGLRAMRELRYSNNAASVLVRLSWPSGRSAAPVVKVLRRCAGSERCAV
jgi:dipeptidyl aminopeptidase/acylaminoacyl peptidase